jgi:hypothetical protein
MNMSPSRRESDSADHRQEAVRACMARFVAEVVQQARPAAGGESASMEWKGPGAGACTREDIETLLDMGYVARKPADPTTERDDQQVVARGEVLALTETGKQYVAQALGTGPIPAGEVPSWDEEDGSLWWQGKRVKEYRHDADNQRHLLRAFQRAGWPRHLDAPLHEEPGVDLRLQLRRTVEDLNRGLRGCGLWFCMDGTGHGVRWKEATGSGDDGGRKA